MKKQVLLFVLMLMPLVASAQIEINGIYYHLNSTDKTAEVTSEWILGYGEWENCYDGKREIVIPENIEHNGYIYSVTTIEGAAFVTCSRLTSVTIPNSVTSIGDDAFSGCSGLTSVYITDIAAWCNISFSNTASNPLTYAHHLYLNDEIVKDLVIPNSVTTIGDYAFWGCSDLTTLTIPNSVTSIGDDAFYGCSGLTSVYITDIAAWCNISFSNTASNPLTYAHHLYLNDEIVKDLVIPNSVTSIGDYAFWGCSDLTSVTVGSGITNIGSKAFANCPEIKEVYCYAKDVPTISNDTFENSYYIKWATLYVPESSVDLYKASAWSQFGNIVGITEGNEGERCAKPIITLLANGKIKVESATEGATCVTNITASNAEPLTGGEISLNTPLTVYTVTAYATAEGFDDSEVATATFRYEKTAGDVNSDGKVNISDVTELVNIILGQ